MSTFTYVYIIESVNFPDRFYVGHARALAIV